MATTYKEDRDAALAALSDDPRKAFSLFRWTLEYPGRLDDDPECWKDALTVLSQIVAPIAGDELAGFIEHAAADPDDLQALHALGYQLVEQSLNGIAATVLARAANRAPTDLAIITELVAALQRAGLNLEACRFLRAAGPLTNDSAVARYLLAFNALMSTDRQETERLLPKLAELAAREEDSDGGLTQLLAELREMLARAAAIAAVSPLDQRDLRGWHFVTTGCVLTHLSPYGFDEGMAGRYAFTQDSASRCREGLERLAAVLAGWRVTPACVFLLAERDSATLGHAAAHFFGVRAVPWPPAGSTEPGLIVAYDLRSLDEATLESLHPQRRGQILFGHAAYWIDELPYTADITTYLYQVNHSPWGERMRMHPETQELETVPPVEGTPTELAQAVVQATREPAELAELEGELAVLRKFAEAVAKISGDAAAGGLRSAGVRRPQRTDSPVKSSRFQ